jgi:NAD(P)-dependent dehydrogenase (short-subunit alcohol dehydrogenase family)
MSTKLGGKVAVITGGNSGSGLATARRFVAEGAHVFITGRRQAELGEASRPIGKHVTGVPWSDLSRGKRREHSGQPSGNADERQIRIFWRRWQKRISAASMAARRRCSLHHR